jgi:hypothetical protein
MFYIKNKEIKNITKIKVIKAGEYVSGDGAVCYYTCGDDPTEMVIRIKTGDISRTILRKVLLFCLNEYGDIYDETKQYSSSEVEYSKKINNLNIVICTKEVDEESND